MSTTTSNYNLVKPTDIETADITVINSNMDIIDNTMKSQSNKISALNSDRIYYGGTSTGSGNAYTITIDPSVTSYSEPLAISFKANYSSTGASTINVNNLGAKAIKKANGSNVTNLIAGSIYTMRYNGTNFILQGEGGSGNATASDILAGKTASTDAGDVVGNIPSKSAQTYNPSTTAQTIASGQYLSGIQTIAPVTGTATVADVISGKVFSSANGINLVGQATIQNLGGAQIQTGSITAPSVINPNTTTHIQTSFPANGIIMIDKYGARGCYVLPPIGVLGYWDAGSTSGEHYNNHGSAGIAFNGTDITWYSSSNTLWYTPVTWIAFKF
ncbi:hypothetical protein [Clostridium beijerinckii]|uniref:hypothetical protein n=1 Tax=Clostridium beijerinckii TaxID=1520 RepID=UPI001493EAE0|nr:hypothetical protein [Clostridium beijerinckii]NOW03243.1 hypothetical protein [Clostridium beijerinckii]NYC03615.1 hypothetical protein [Clostridium beijerinckii]